MDKEQFIKEVVSLRSRVLDYAKRFAKDGVEIEIEDVVQEVFLKLYLMREKLDGYNSIYALLVTMVKNASITIIRNNKDYLKTKVDNTIVCKEQNPYAALERKDSMNQVMRAISYLPRLQQFILKMKHIEGMSINEIAELIGSSPEAVKVNLSRARQRVASRLIQMRDNGE